MNCNGYVIRAMDKNYNTKFSKQTMWECEVGIIYRNAKKDYPHCTVHIWELHAKEVTKKYENENEDLSCAINAALINGGCKDEA